jgi:hypothetical protein
VKWACRRYTRQNKLNFRSLSGLALELELATQAICDDIVDDMKAGASAALVASASSEKVS